MRVVDTANLYQIIVDNLCEGVLVVDHERRVLFWNRGAERITGCRGTDMLTHHNWAGVLTHEDEYGAILAGGHCPLAQTIKDGIPREGRVFLHHEDGHRLPVRIHTVALRDEQGQIWGAIESFVEAFATP
jgi:PAS domain S-box-containing protein